MKETILPLLLAGLSLGFAAGTSPGPFQAYLINLALARGWRAGLVAALAPFVSDIPVAAITLFLLRQVPASLLRYISLAGAAVIFYVAWGLFKTWRSEGESGRVQDPPQREVEPAPVPSGGFWRGVLMNMSGPGPWVGWTTVLGPLAVETWRVSPPSAVAFVFGFYIALVGTMAGIAMLFYQTHRLSPRFTRAVRGLSIVVLVAFGGSLVWRAVG